MIGTVAVMVGAAWLMRRCGGAAWEGMEQALDPAVHQPNTLVAAAPKGNVERRTPWTQRQGRGKPARSVHACDRATATTRRDKGKI